MPLPPATAKALDRIGIAWEADAPLAKRTYWRAGGPADALIRARTVADLQAVQRAASETETAVTVLGNASNLLVADAGIRGIVVQLDGDLAQAEATDDSPAPAIRAGGGLKLVVLLARARKAGWTGLGCFAGIPGTVGGAIRMNAGSTLGETEATLLDVDVVLRSGERATLPRDELRMSYRTCHLPEGAIVASARLRTTGEDAEASEAHIRTFLDRRKATQPLDLPSCGSTFRNPPGDHAGRLVEAAGLKGFTIGRAQVSEKHANFVVNLGEASAADIRAVVDHMQATVRERFGVDLEREVHFVGDWPVP